jgi:hypothetical protein
VVVWWWWWWWVFTNYNTTLTKLFCFVLLVGLWQFSSKKECLILT